MFESTHPLVSFPNTSATRIPSVLLFVSRLSHGDAEGRLTRSSRPSWRHSFATVSRTVGVHAHGSFGVVGILDALEGDLHGCRSRSLRLFPFYLVVATRWTRHRVDVMRDGTRECVGNRRDRNVGNKSRDLFVRRGGRERAEKRVEGGIGGRGRGEDEGKDLDRKSRRKRVRAWIFGGVVASRRGGGGPRGKDPTGTRVHGAMAGVVLCCVHC